jgi:hypothetical protein
VSLPDFVADDAADDGTTDRSDRTATRQNRTRNTADTGADRSVFPAFRHSGASTQALATDRQRNNVQ